MDSKASSYPVSGPHEASNNDELFMQQSLVFSDTLKDLKNLRKQLYSAAEYFEISYKKRDQKELVLEALKDYTVKALISAVDHLGSVAYKVNSIFDEKISEASALELQFSCLEQRVQTCQDYVNKGGLSQQSLVIDTPKHHKRYIFPVEEKADGIDQTVMHHQRRSLAAEHNFKNAVGAMVKGKPSHLIREGHPTLQSPQFITRQGSFTFLRASTSKQAVKRSVSPQRFQAQLLRSGSLRNRSTSPNHAAEKPRYPSEPRRAISLARYSQRDKVRDAEQYAGKSKRLFKALLSMRRPRNDGSLYKFLDET